VSSLNSIYYGNFSNLEISYDGLKKHIYQLEKHQSGLNTGYHDLESNERMSLIGNTDVDTAFTHLLDRELQKISSFYDHQEEITLDEVAELKDLVRQQDDSTFNGTNHYPPYHEEDDDEDDEGEDDGGVDTHSRERSRSGRQPSVTFNADVKGFGSSHNI
jgi:phosphate transporter